jgi:hypothetical protein
MRRSSRFVFGIAVAILVSLAVALPAAAKGPAPTGTALPFTFGGSGMTFACDGVTVYSPPILGGPTCAANTPFYLLHGVIGATTTTKKGGSLGELRNDSLTYFQVIVDGVVQSCTPEVTVTGPDSAGVYTVSHLDLCNFPAGMTGPHTFTFNFSADGTVFFSETETYVFS